MRSTRLCSHEGTIFNRLKWKLKKKKGDEEENESAKAPESVIVIAEKFKNFSPEWPILSERKQ